MKKLITVAALSAFAFIAPAYAADAAKAPSAQQNKMTECNKEAGDKKGDERKAFMKTCLSAKKATQQDKMKTCNADAKTKALLGHFSGLEITNALIIDGAEVNTGFAQAARNIPHIDVLPIQGANVYDILRHKELVLSKEAVAALEARLK